LFAVARIKCDITRCHITIIQIDINPTPYYLTVTELNAGTRVLENALVPPMGESAVKLPSDAGSNITYRTINDYGALTPKMTGVME
jgi:fimbrial chaperone protein